MIRFVFALAFLLLGCQRAQQPNVRVLGVHDSAAGHVFVQVTNPATRTMRLTKLEYVFASAHGATVSEGELDLQREIPAGAAVVVEVPLDSEAATALTLRGKLTAELDQIPRTFDVHAQIQPR